jgi:hypothetical protein
MDDCRSKTRRASLAVGLVLLAGCAAGGGLRPLDASHPASADAPEGVVREPSAFRAGVREPEVAPAPHTHHHHGGETSDAK